MKLLKSFSDISIVKHELCFYFFNTNIAKIDKNFEKLKNLSNLLKI